MTAARRGAAALCIVLLVAASVAATILLWRTSVPSDLVLPDLDPRDRFPAEDLAEAESYRSLTNILNLLGSIAMVVALGVYALVGGRFARESAAGRIGTGMLLGMLGLAFVWFAQLPFGIAQLWWARRHDVTGVGYVEWLWEYWATAGGKFLFISLALLVVMGLAGVWRRYWWVAAPPVLAAIALAFAFVQPYLLPGLEPARGAVERDVERLAAAQGVSEPDVRVIETYGATEAPNALAAGIGPSQRVVLFDTLADEFERDQVRTVLAHELGHLSRDHIWKLVAWLALLAIPVAYITALATRRRGGLYEPAAVPTAVAVVVALMFVASPLQHALSQRYEAEADWIALQTTRDPGAASALFAEFSRVALLDPDPPAWSRRLLDSHPSILRRLEMVEAWRAREEADARE